MSVAIPCPEPGCEFEQHGMEHPHGRRIPANLGAVDDITQRLGVLMTSLHQNTVWVSVPLRRVSRWQRFWRWITLR